jgi:hypothetical protein
LGWPKEVNAVVVGIQSTIIQMMLPWHAKDFKLKKTERASEAWSF